jgi:hypothetical protein
MTTRATTRATTVTLNRILTRLSELEAAHARLAEENARVLANNAALRAEVSALRASAAGAGRGKLARAGRTSRRGLLKLGGVAAATVAAGVLAAETSTGTAHAHSDAITFQQSASGSGNIAIEGDGTSGAVGVKGTSDTSIGVFGSSDSGEGVHGHSNTLTGVLGLSGSGTGVFGASSTGYGGVFSGPNAPLWLSTGGVPGAPTSGLHNQGEIYLDSTATLWVCIVGDRSNVGTWVRVGMVSDGHAGGGLNFLATPVRLLETRPGFSDGVTNKGSPLTSGSAYTFPVAGGGGIPSNASGVLGTITALSPSAGGNLKFWPAGPSHW